MASTHHKSVLAGKSLTTDAASDWYAVNEGDIAGIDVVWGTGTAAGAVAFQATNDPDNANALQTITTITHPDRAYAEPRAYKFIRAKITTNLTSGTLD